MKILKAIVKEFILPFIRLVTLFAPAVIVIEGLSFGMCALLLAADLVICLASGFASGIMELNR